MISNYAATEYNKYVLFAKFLAISLIGMYGLTPYLVDLIGLYSVPWAIQNLLLSSSLIVSFYFLPGDTNKSNLFNAIPEDLYLKKYLIFLIFCLSLIVFYLYPWHDDRESFGASIAAIFRAAWLLVMFSSVTQCEKNKIRIFILSVILMYIDQSRTYFMIGILAISISSIYRKKLVVIGLFLVILLASVRMNVTGSASEYMLYGVIGEGYNATKPIGQISSISNVHVNYLGHLFHTFFQPLIFPFEFFANRILNLQIPQQFDYFSEPVGLYLGEKLSPMGGWYIVADFVYYGALGVPLLMAYNYITWVITCKLLNTKDFPFGSFVFLISIKATPYVYWKFVFYIAAVFFVVNIFNRLKLG